MIAASLSFKVAFIPASSGQGTAGGTGIRRRKETRSSSLFTCARINARAGLKTVASSVRAKVASALRKEGSSKLPGNTCSLSISAMRSPVAVSRTT